MNRAAPMVMLVCLSAYGCSADLDPQQPSAAGMPATNSEETAPVGGAGAGAACDPAAPLFTIAGTPLRAALPLRLTHEVALAGEGLALTEIAQQNPSAGLRWQGDRMFLLADVGFWDIPVAGPARWYPTSSTLIWGVRAGDLDADGDDDLLVLSVSLNPNLGAELDADAGPPSPLVTRLAVWERGPDGLAERAELRNVAAMSFPMPYELGDLEADGDLDIVTYERGAAVGYINQGGFVLERRTLSEATPGNENLGALVVHLADRNDDGLLDLLVVGGDPLVSPLENRMFVLLAESSSRFGAMGPSTIGKSPLVPHGPDGIGIGIADLTGDGLADVVMQDPAAPDDGILRLHKSTSASELAPVTELRGLGFGFADIDGDGTTDLVTTRSQQLQALISRKPELFEPRELGIDASMLSYVVDPSQPALHALRKRNPCTPP